MPADNFIARPHNANMARRGTKKAGLPWYLNEWMETLGIKTQVELMKRTGWSKATTSQLVNGDQTFSPSVLKAASAALGIEPFELLLPPARALAIRRFYAEAKQVVETGASGSVWVADMIPVGSETPRELADLSVGESNHLGPMRSRN